MKEKKTFRTMTDDEKALLTGEWDRRLTGGLPPDVRFALLLFSQKTDAGLQVDYATNASKEAMADALREMADKLEAEAAQAAGLVTCPQCRGEKSHVMGPLAWSCTMCDGKGKVPAPKEPVGGVKCLECGRPTGDTFPICAKCGRK